MDRSIFNAQVYTSSYKRESLVTTTSLDHIFDIPELILAFNILFHHNTFSVLVLILQGLPAAVYSMMSLQDNLHLYVTSMSIVWKILFSLFLVYFVCLQYLMLIKILVFPSSSSK